MPASQHSPGQQSSRPGLARLTLSAFVVLAAEPLYVLVDTAVIGHLDRTSLAALGVGGAILSMIALMGNFLAYGTTSRSARAFGAGDQRAALNEGVQATWMALGLGLLTVVAAELGAGWLTTVLAGGTGQVQHAAESWLRIAVLGVPGIMIALAGNGWLRGMHRTGQPVRYVLAANGLSAVLSPILVYPLGFGLNGSAIANVIAQCVGGGAFLLALVRAMAAEGGKDRSRWRPAPRVLVAQLALGRDLVIRQLSLQAGFLTAAGVASRMGDAQIAAHQVALQLWFLLALGLDAFAIAAQSVVGSSLGAGDLARARAVARRVAVQGLCAGVVLAIVLGALVLPVPRLFTSSDAVISQIHVLWPWFVATQPVCGLLFALDGVLMGAGDMRFLRTLTITASVLIFLPVDLAALHWHWGLGGVWAGLLAFMVIRCAGVVARVRGTSWAVGGVAR
jgi:putative MATE family efflux protein